MSQQNEEIDWQAYLLKKQREHLRRQRYQRLGVKAGFAALLLATFAWNLRSFAGGEESPSPAKSVIDENKGERPLGKPEKMGSAQGLDWESELWAELAARQSWLLACMEGDTLPAFTWHFSYQPEIGELLHRSFDWRGAPEPDYTQSACILKSLQQDFLPSGLEARRWHQLSFGFE